MPLRLAPAGRAQGRRAFLQLLAAGCALPLRGLAAQETPREGFHVHPKDSIQDALDAAA